MTCPPSRTRPSTEPRADSLAVARAGQTRGGGWTHRLAPVLAPLLAASLIAVGIVPAAAAGTGDGASLPLAPRGNDEVAVSGPASGAAEGAESEASAPAGASTSEAEAPGDLSAQAKAATAARTADPTPQTWRAEAQAYEAAGDYAGAAAAWRGHLDALGPDDPTRSDAEAALAAVEAKRRGTVADEPGSTHRDTLDRRWAPPPKKTAPKKKKKKRVPPPPPADEGRDDRVVDKWYFWVTLGAIIASAAAVTGVAIRASRQDEPDALGQARDPMTGPTLLRF